MIPGPDFDHIPPPVGRQQPTRPRTEKASFTMTRLVLDDSSPIDGLTTPDGEPWPYTLTFGEETVLADNLGDLISYLMPAYADIPHDDEGNDAALLFRWEEAVRAAQATQAAHAGHLAERGEFVPADETEEVLTAILTDRIYPVEGIDRWEHVVPLVLVATDYAPYTDRVPPRGNVQFVDPHDEMRFLKSLSGLGLVEFFTHTDI